MQLTLNSLHHTEYVWHCMHTLLFLITTPLVSSLRGIHISYSCNSRQSAMSQHYLCFAQGIGNKRHVLGLVIFGGLQGTGQLILVSDEQMPLLKV